MPQDSHTRLSKMREQVRCFPKEPHPLLRTRGDGGSAEVESLF